MPLEKKAPIIATTIAFFLAIMKFIVWIMSGSVALLSSAMDSLLDTWVSIFNYFAIKFSLDPADEDHNYGHWKIEGIAGTIEWTIITISGLYIIYASINKFINPEPIQYLNWTLIVMWISIMATGWLVYFLNSVYKKTGNIVIKWDALHYKTDLFTNIAVIWVLSFLYFFPSLVIIDAIIWWLIWIYIIYEAYKLIKEWINLLLDTALEEHIKVEKSIQFFVNNKTIQNFHDLKTRSGWSREKFVEFHFVLPPETTILEAHNVWDKIEESIKNINSKAKWNFVYHVDYFDDSEK
jgi:cation diffusion facilitator family transporter